MTRQLDRLEWHVDLSNETLALFIRFWLTTAAPLPDSAMNAVQVPGRRRCTEAGPRLKNEVAQEVGPTD